MEIIKQIWSPCQGLLAGLIQADVPAGPGSHPLTIFLAEFWTTNKRLLVDLHGLTETDIAYCLAYLLVTHACTFSAAFLLSHRPQRTPLLLCELLLIPMLLLMPALLPGQAARLVMGLHNFTYCLYIHGRVMQFLHSKPADTPVGAIDAAPAGGFQGTLRKSGAEAPPAIAVTADSPSTLTVRAKYAPGTFPYELTSMLFYFMYPHLDITPRCLPSAWELLKWLQVLVAFDGLIFLTQEVIPAVISAPNQLVFRSFVGGIFIVTSLELVYLCLSVTCQPLGFRIPVEHYHSTPLLACSIAEFWNIRWNPFIAKLLQLSCYKPMLHAKCSREVTVIGCFATSAVLHAYPIYISTRDAGDAMSMAGFFVLQSVFVFVEIGLQTICERVLLRERSMPFGREKAGEKEVTGVRKRTASEDILHDADNEEEEQPPAPAAAAVAVRKVRSNYSQVKLLPHQSLMEYLLMATIVYVLYCHLETAAAGWSPKTIAIAIALIITCLRNVYDLQEQHVAMKSADMTLRARRVLCNMIGWAYMLTVVLLALPLFALPMLHSLEFLYAKSFVVGPLVRAVEMAWTSSL